MRPIFKTQNRAVAAAFVVAPCPFVFVLGLPMFWLLSRGLSIHPQSLVAGLRGILALEKFDGGHVAIRIRVDIYHVIA